jgi:hypothetical protein
VGQFEIADIGLPKNEHRGSQERPPAVIVGNMLLAAALDARLLEIVFSPVAIGLPDISSDPNAIKVAFITERFECARQRQHVAYRDLDGH